MDREWGPAQRRNWGGQLPYLKTVLKAEHLDFNEDGIVAYKRRDGDKKFYKIMRFCCHDSIRRKLYLDYKNK